MAVNNLLKAVVQGSVGSDTFSFGIWVRCATAYTSAADLRADLNAWDTANAGTTSPTAYNQLQGLLSNNATWNQLALYFYDNPVNAADYVAIKTINHPGAGDGNSMRQQAICVTLETGLSGSSYRGRAYLPATGCVGAIGNVIAAADQTKASLGYVNTAVNLLQAVRGGSGGDGSRIVVYSGKKALTTDVTEVSIDNRFDVQRRRAEKQAGVRTSYTGPNP